MNPLRILVVGQTPPPVHGQAVMIQTMLEGVYSGIELIHVPMHFSQTLDEVGRFRLGKLGELRLLISRILAAKRRSGAATLYYPPAGPNRLPMWRDITLLLAVRPFFRRIIFHFHAGGLTDELYPRLRDWERVAFRWAYSRPDATIRMSPRTPATIELLQPKADFIVPYGIPDHAGRRAASNDATQRNGRRLLFVGALRESKGFMVLLEACRLLAARNIEFQLEAMGGFQSAAFEAEVHRFLEENRLADRVRLLGILTGTAKQAAFARADIFCFPTYYESEAFSVVLVEALSYGLPIVTTNWRGIPDIVPDGECGYLVPIHNPVAVADKVAMLLEDAALRARLGRAGRQRYLEHYTLERFYDRLGHVFHAVQQS